MTPESLTRTLEEFLARTREGRVMEDGVQAFDLADAKYSVSGDYNKCLLHIWSPERNIVRRVVDLEVRSEVLRLKVQRLGQSRPNKLEICCHRDRRPAGAKRLARLSYQRTLQRLLERRFSAYKVAQLSSGMNLEQSFGPAYTRGLLRQGRSGFAVLGVNAGESRATVDAALTFGILWLDLCRQSRAGVVVEGLKLFVPAKCSDVVRQRMGHLNRTAAKWQLYEYDEQEDSLQEIDIADRGNIDTRLVRCVNEAAALERFAEPVAWVRKIMPEVEVAVLSAAEIAFRHYGLEFARARLTQEAGSLDSSARVIWGLGTAEKTLSAHNAEAFAKLVREIGEVRHAEGPKDHRLWRMHPERWLEALVKRNVRSLDEGLEEVCVYSQVPAFSASDRAMIDVLAVTRQGRLVVVELKADEDIHLPLQGLDYWSRVAWHHACGEFQRFGYFPGVELSGEEPLLYLAAPALRVHPATDTLLKYFSPEIDWTVIGIDERWRSGVRRVFRKRAERNAGLRRSA